MGTVFNMKFVLALVLGLGISVQAKNFGGLTVDGFGEVYVCGPDWTGDFITMNGNGGFALHGGGRIYLCSTPSDGMDPGMYWQTPLDGYHFSYKVDLSNVGCHCNAAGYFINMPGPGPGEGGDWYCDANFVGGQWCPEYDCLESNKYTVAATLHRCNGGLGNWGDCDRGGCQANAYNVDSSMFCPEDRCKINTNKPFTISHMQESSYANIWMEQDGKEASFNVCNDGGYCSDMAKSYGGMVFSASLWGGGGIDMGWLDGMTGCGGECNIGGSSVTFSEFTLWSENDKPTTKPPGPGTTNPPGPTTKPPPSDCDVCAGSESDDRCYHPETDEHGGLGCSACGRPGCRFCGYDVYPDCIHS